MQDLIVSNINGNGYGRFRIQVDVEVEQTVYLRLIGNNAVTDIFDYTVKVRKMSVEPVKTYTLALGGTATGHYEDSGEYDIISFTAEEDGIYLFTGENAESGICAGLYNDAELNDSISSTSEYSGPFTMRAKLTAGQTVYFRPTGYNSYDSCDYTVSVTKKEVVVREPIALTLDTETEGNFEDIDDYVCMPEQEPHLHGLKTALCRTRNRNLARVKPHLLCMPVCATSIISITE